MATIRSLKQDSLKITKVTDTFSDLIHLDKSTHQQIFFELDIKLTTCSDFSGLQVLHPIISVKDQSE